MVGRIKAFSHRASCICLSANTLHCLIRVFQKYDLRILEISIEVEVDTVCGQLAPFKKFMLEAIMAPIAMSLQLAKVVLHLHATFLAELLMLNFVFDGKVLLMFQEQLMNHFG